MGELAREEGGGDVACMGLVVCRFLSRKRSRRCRQRRDGIDATLSVKMETDIKKRLGE